MFARLASPTRFSYGHHAVGVMGRDAGDARPRIAAVC